MAFKKGVLFSPVNGKIIKIEKSFSHPQFGDQMTRIQIVVPWWKEMGVFLPVTSEVKNMVVNEGSTHFRYSPITDITDKNNALFKSLSLILEGVNNERVGLQFIKCPVGAWPEIGIIPGDRGKAQVNIGYFPFGGTTVIYLPDSYELLVEPENEVLAGETLLAGSPE